MGADALNEAILDILESSKDFIIEQSPEIIQQLILSEKIRSITLAAVFGLGIVIFLACRFVFLKKKEKSLFDEELAILNFLSGLTAFVFFIFLVFQIDNLIRLYFCPKVFLLETLRKFVTHGA